MKSLTFAEFFPLPPGTIFGQATGLPHQFSTGLYRKGKSWEVPEDDGQEDQDDDPFIAYDDLLFNNDGENWGTDYVYPGELGEDHRFLVYEPADLDRLAELIGRGRGWGTVAQQLPADESAPKSSVAAESEISAILDQISPDWPEMAQLLSEGHANRLRLSTFRSIARDLKNTDW